MCATAGLVLSSDEEEIIGSVWAPNRIMFQTPDAGTELAKDSVVKIGITGDWLTGPAVPAGDGPAW